MATYVKGDEVTKTTDGTAVTKDVSYELFEKVGEAYNSLATGDEINFEVSALGLAVGNHSLVVQAHADGYDSSDYSNEVKYEIGLLAKTVEEIQSSLMLYTARDVNSVGAASTSLNADNVEYISGSASTCLFSNIPLHVGSKVEFMVTTSGGNFCMGFETDINGDWTAKNWKSDNTGIVIPASHLWTTSSGSCSYLDRLTGNYKNTNPALTVDLTKKITFEVLQNGFRVYQNDELLYTVTENDSNPYITHTGIPTYFCFASNTACSINIFNIEVPENI